MNKRIGVFYDGNYFLHISNYYNYNHSKKSRISISGLHDFIRYKVAVEEKADIRHCQIVDAHYFRSRLNAQEASQKGNLLFYDRVFDDILMSEGVITHYIPIRNSGSMRQERSIDIWMVLEAYELALHKKFDILVLIGSDGDYVPLVRKINTLGTRIMIMSWDFEFMTEEGQRIVTKTSHDLIREVAYPVAMHETIEEGLKQNEPMIKSLFVQSTLSRAIVKNASENSYSSQILSLKNGYGFIKFPPNNLFFHFGSYLGPDISGIREGDHVSFVLDQNEKGEQIAVNVELIGSDHEDEHLRPEDV